MEGEFELDMRLLIQPREAGGVQAAAQWQIGHTAAQGARVIAWIFENARVLFGPDNRWGETVSLKVAFEFLCRSQFADMISILQLYFMAMNSRWDWRRKLDLQSSAFGNQNRPGSLLSLYIQQCEALKLRILATILRISPYSPRREVSLFAPHIDWPWELAPMLPPSPHGEECLEDFARRWKTVFQVYENYYGAVPIIDALAQSVTK